MTEEWWRIHDDGFSGPVRNLRAARVHHMVVEGAGDQNAMRILYLIVTVLLIVSLGLLEVVAARGVFTP